MDHGQHSRRQSSSGRYAVFLESLLNEYVNGRVPCDTMRFGEVFANRHFSVATPQRSDLREAINEAIIELTESGYLDQLKQKWFSDSSECRKPVETDDSKRQRPYYTVLSDFTAPFCILIIGMALAVVVALIEFLVRAKSDSTRLNLPMGQILRRHLLPADTSNQPTVDPVIHQ